MDVVTNAIQPTGQQQAIEMIKAMNKPMLTAEALLLLNATANGMASTNGMVIQPNVAIKTRGV